MLLKHIGSLRLQKTERQKKKSYGTYIYWQAAKKDGLEIRNYADSLY